MKTHVVETDFEDPSDSITSLPVRVNDAKWCRTYLLYYVEYSGVIEQPNNTRGFRQCLTIPDLPYALALNTPNANTENKTKCNKVETRTPGLS